MILFFNKEGVFMKYSFSSYIKFRNCGECMLLVNIHDNSIVNMSIKTFLYLQEIIKKDINIDDLVIKNIELYNFLKILKEKKIIEDY